MTQSLDPAQGPAHGDPACSKACGDCVDPGALAGVLTVFVAGDFVPREGGGLRKPVHCGPCITRIAGKDAGLVHGAKASRGGPAYARKRQLPVKAALCRPFGQTAFSRALANL